MGAELVYQARTVVLLANGERKVESVTQSLLGKVTPGVPISYGQKYAENGDTLIYVLDKIAGRELLAHKGALNEKKIALEDWT
jgi:glucosamine-6-phosphate deaminase